MQRWYPLSVALLPFVLSGCAGSQAIQESSPGDADCKSGVAYGSILLQTPKTSWTNAGVKIDISFLNRGSQPVNPMGGYIGGDTVVTEFRLVNDSGTIFGAKNHNSVWGTHSITDSLNPGMTWTGAILFEVPRGNYTLTIERVGVGNAPGGKFSCRLV
jgi:hypothetical protein